MKNSGVLGLVALALVSCGCAGYQAKLENAQKKAKDLAVKVECRAKVVAPYLDYVLEADLPAVLDGADISDVLAVSGVAKAEVEKVKAEFKACGALK